MAPKTSAAAAAAAAAGSLRVSRGAADWDRLLLQQHRPGREEADERENNKNRGKEPLFLEGKAIVLLLLLLLLLLLGALRYVGASWV